MQEKLEGFTAYQRKTQHHEEVELSCSSADHLTGCIEHEVPYCK